MVLKLDGTSQTLVQVTSGHTGEIMGLYLIPEGVSIDKFEQVFEETNDQDYFDENNDLYVKRIYAYESILNVQ